MPWQDRIRQAAYNSPSGIRLTFSYEDLRKTIDKKTTGFDFPDADGTYVQDLGHTSYKLPLRIFFWGDDYDTERDAFEKALLEIGTGKLEHPVYGVKNVVPFGTITTRDDLKTAANQAVIEVVFWETIGLIYPTSQNDPASDVINSIEEYNAAIGEELEESLKLDTAFKRVTFENQYLALLDNAASGLQVIADTQADVMRQFDNVKDSITRGIDILIGDPITLAFQTAIMLQAPSRALTSITARFNAYIDLAKNIIGGESSVATEKNDFTSNEFHAKDLYASTYTTGSILSSVNNQFTTKPEAIQAAESILTQLEEVTNWRDDNFEALDEIDTGGSYQKLQESAALAAGFLVQISFTLKQERCIVLDRDRTIIDLAAELYGSVDSELDFLIKSNNLSGSEILELPRGRKIVYYI